MADQPELSAPENYEIANPEIQSIMKKIGERIGSAIPRPQWGFMLMIFESGTEGNPGANFYICSHNRDDTIKMMLEWIDRQTAPETKP